MTILCVIVESVDECAITVTDSNSGNKYKIAYAAYQDGHNTSYANHSYLRQLVKTGMKLSIVGAHIDDNCTITAEYIIIIPDCLVDISSVATCFDDYGDASPYAYLINKLKPKALTEPIMLGNFASQLLDETVSGRFHSTADSFKRFARGNATALSACRIGNNFMSNATLQQENISNAIQKLPQEYGACSGSVLEPSFISPILGLQGRMDYLQLDYSVLIEQKSGRGAYNPDDESTPIARVSHCVQLLLYRAILQYGGFNSGVINSLLLYSKYENSLLPVGTNHELLFKALKLRNQIAWLEMWLTKGNHVSMLARLTPEIICPHGHGYSFDHFTRPQIAAITDPIRHAAPLERAYYFRFVRFVLAEHLLSKTGTPDREGSGFASAWNDSPDERRAVGNLYDGLTLKERRSNADGQVGAVVFEYGNYVDSDISNFREGDIVMFYSYNPQVVGEPLVTRHMFFRGSITTINTEYIEVSLRNPQSDPYVFRGDMWAIEHDFTESTSNALLRGLQMFLSAPLRRRQLLLSQCKPDIGSIEPLNGDYTNSVTGDTEFNELVRRVKRAKDFFLIIGPPGTGKTSYGMLNVLREQLTDPASSVLVMAYTNRAVDELCGKIESSGIDYIRIGNTQGCAKQYRSHMVDKLAEKCDSIEGMRQMIRDARVICGTTTAFNSNMQLFGMKSFSLAIVDEASQILEPQIIGLLSAQNHGKSSIRKFVLIGDEKQLPAVVQQSSEESAISDRLLLDAGFTDCRMSLFERLIRKWRPDGHDNAVSYMLTKQGRMHPEIAEFANRSFYDGHLCAVPLKHQTEIWSKPHVRFIACESKDDQLDDAVDYKTNKQEAGIIAEIVWRIWKEEPYFDPLQTVGVIVPYRNQVSTVRRAIENIERGHGVTGLSRITIDTVERYQGSQRDTIIYGFTIKRADQLSFLTDSQYTDPVTGKIIDRKLNVAMTRAMRRLFIVGNPSVLRQNSVFSHLLDAIT